MGRRICAYCGKEIYGYPHITIWDEQQRESIGVRFHNFEEALLYLAKKLGYKVEIQKT